MERSKKNVYAPTVTGPPVETRITHGLQDLILKPVVRVISRYNRASSSPA